MRALPYPAGDFGRIEVCSPPSLHRCPTDRLKVVGPKRMGTPPPVMAARLMRLRGLVGRAPSGSRCAERTVPVWPLAPVVTETAGLTSSSAVRCGAHRLRDRGPYGPVSHGATCRQRTPRSSIAR